jgi:hypothetical protein
MIPKCCTARVDSDQTLAHTCSWLLLITPKVLGAAHVRPYSERKHAEGTRSVDQGAAEAAGQA